jgi:catechol 2,3-dioxygenase-like lactoylglutathione lyase family enzyme
MQPRITLITLGVDDLERALRFYRDGLGLPTEGIVGTEFERGAVAFFDLQSGVKLALQLFSGSRRPPLGSRLEPGLETSGLIRPHPRGPFSRGTECRSTNRKTTGSARR